MWTPSYTRAGCIVLRLSVDLEEAPDERPLPEPDPHAGQLLAKNLGLPNPVRLERHRGEPLVDGNVVVGGEGRLGKSIEVALRLRRRPRQGRAEGDKFKALVFDATGLTSERAARRAAAVLHPLMRSLRTCPRVVVLGTPRSRCTAPSGSPSARSRASPASRQGDRPRRHGAAGVRRPRGGRRDHLHLGFLSPKSAYVSGQVIRIGAHGPTEAARSRTGPSR